MSLMKWFLPKTDSNPAESNPAGDRPDKQVHVINTAAVSAPSPDFGRAVDDATCLLVYAAKAGKDVDDTTRSSILRAKAAINVGWDETVAANFLAAFTKLAAELYPVTAESLRASCSNLTKPAIKSLRNWAFVLAVPIILLSVLGFVSSAISNAISADITTANELVVKLRSELGTQEAPTAGVPGRPFPPGLSEGDVITQLQQYASTIRAIDARSRQLNWFVLNTEHDPFAQLRWYSDESKRQRADKQQRIAAGETNQQQLDAMPDNGKTLKEIFQLPVGLPNMPQASDTLTTTYQDVRSFAQNVLIGVSSYGAITTCLLPVLYALLGTCAYLLRCFEEEVRNKTFMPSSRANWARFLIAGIGGAVVGLLVFSRSPRRLHFPSGHRLLVGYAVDVFFSFLEGLLQSFCKRRNGASSPAAAT